MGAEGIFVQALVYLGAAVVAVPVAKRLGLGSVLGYLLAGAVIGPFALGLVGHEGQDVMHFAEFGVVMMLFLVGLELQPSLLWRLRGSLVGMGGAQMLVTTAAVAASGLALGLEWRPALAVGMILAISSTAIVLQTLNEKGLMNTTAGRGAFAVLLFQDMAFIPILALLPLLAVTGGGAVSAETWSDDLPGWIQGGLVLGAVASVVVAGRFFVRPAFRVIARTGLRELFTAASLLLVVGITVLMSLVGLSPALGTFLAGVVLADSEFRHQLEADIAPFKGLLLGLFFISVGASIDFGIVANSPGPVFGLLVLLLGIKLVILAGVARGSRMGTDQGLVFSFALAQGGEFAFVLLSFGVQHGVMDSGLGSLLTVVVALSMVVTPLLMVFNERLLLPRVGTLETPFRPADEVHELNPVIIAGFGRFGNIVGRFLRANGIRPTILEADSDRVEVLRKLGLQVYYGDSTRRDLLESAGITQARLLVVALEDSESSLELVRMAKQHWPHLTILARATDRPAAYALLAEGLEHVYRETLDTSLQLGVDALRLLGFRGYNATRAAKLFRRQDEVMLRELAGATDDRKAYISLARERIRGLEETLQAEQTRPVERNAGWDTTSMRTEYGATPEDKSA
jgi:CPA2 family monovalent cation:H+ antiporter-2